MKTFIKVELTIYENTKKIKTQKINWFYENDENAEKKFKQLEELCHNYKNYCKGWKCLSVNKIVQNFDD